MDPDEVMERVLVVWLATYDTGAIQTHTVT
jgi:hypothetical protein